MKRISITILLTLIMVLPVLAENSAGSQELSKPQGDRIWLTSASGAPGDVINIDLMIGNAMTEVDAVTITLKYDTSKLQYIDWADGSLNPGWVMFNINEKSDGEISVGGFCVKTAIKTGSEGSIASFSFKIKPEASGDALISLDKIRDDVQGFNFENGKIRIEAASVMNQ
ncbi:hypothetical protein JW823_10110 [bacterium]|nr:hypothetical protein [candidate division CSSED10-310 bacterium]